MLLGSLVAGTVLLSSWSPNMIWYLVYDLLVVEAVFYFWKGDLDSKTVLSAVSEVCGCLRLICVTYNHSLFNMRNENL